MPKLVYILWTAFVCHAVLTANCCTGTEICADCEQKRSASEPDTEDSIEAGNPQKRNVAAVPHSSDRDVLADTAERHSSAESLAGHPSDDKELPRRDQAQDTRAQLADEEIKGKASSGLSVEAPSMLVTGAKTSQTATDVQGDARQNSGEQHPLQEDDTGRGAVLPARKLTRKKRNSVDPIDETSNVPKDLGCHKVPAGTMIHVNRVSQKLVTVNNCVYQCWTKNQKYALLKKGYKCYCMLDIAGVSTYFVPPEDCDAHCQGNALQICGSRDWSSYSIYSTGLVAMPSDLKLPVADVKGASRGCFRHPPFDNPDGVLFRSGRLTTAACIVRCGQLKYKFAMLWVGDFCYCKNTLPDTEARSDQKCQEKCRGDETMLCGGIGYVSAFATKYSGHEIPVPQEQFKYDKWMEIKFKDDFMKNKVMENVTNARRDTYLNYDYDEEESTQSRKKRSQRHLEPAWSSSNASEVDVRHDDHSFLEHQTRVLDRSKGFTKVDREQQRLQILFASITSVLLVLAALVLGFNLYKWQKHRERLRLEQGRRGRFDIDTPPPSLIDYRGINQHPPWSHSAPPPLWHTRNHTRV